MNKMEFRVINKNIEATTNEEGVLHIRGIANTGLEDVGGDTFTTDALLSITEQATSHNLHMDHDSTIDGVLGPITSAELTDEGVVIDADVVNSQYKEKIRELLGGGARFGLSVSGVSLLDKNNKHDINNITLTEISLTPIPCDQATMGSVTIAKSFAEIFRENDCDIVEVEKMVEESNITKQEAIDLINEAFNERRQADLEEIRGELKNEYEVQIKELEARIETLESQAQDTKVSDVVDEDAVVEEVEATVQEKREEEDDKKEKEGVPQYTEADIPTTPEKTDEEEKPAKKEEDEDDEEEIKKNIDLIEEIVEKRLEKIFTNKNASDIHFKYNEEAESDAQTQETANIQKNVFTIREAAEKIAKH